MTAKRRKLTSPSFIGPIPEGWLKSHRKDWYKHHLHINYSSRASTFSAGSNVSHLRRVTGLEGPSSSALYARVFPQPVDLDGVDAEDDAVAGQSQAAVVADAPPAVPIPRSEDAQGHVQQGDGAIETADQSSESQPHLATVAPSQQGSSTLERQETPSSKGVDGTLGEARKTNSISLAEGSPTSADAANSRSSLLRDRGAGPGESKGRDVPVDSPLAAQVKKAEHLPRQPNGIITYPENGSAEALSGQTLDPISPGLVRFNLPDEATKKSRQMRHDFPQMNPIRAVHSFRQRKEKPGEMIKMEKMLVRVDATLQDIPDDYDENAALKIESNMVEKWREYVVVCRERINEEADLTLQLYKSRVIPATQTDKFKKRATHEIALKRKSTKVNLYSALDKTLVVTVPGHHGSTIYLMRPRSTASSAEWYTFLQTALGWQRPRDLQVHVPDLSLTLEIDDPFSKVEAQRDVANTLSDSDAAMKMMQTEQAVAGDIIKRCLAILDKEPEWASTAQRWFTSDRVGLAWKRYDRLEWIQGANEKKMYGTIAMQKTHDLQLRPKQHYPTSAPTLEVDGSTDRHGGGGEEEEEPTPVEGFLIRLTSRRGRDQRFGRMFYKRLYFFTHNQYLCFCRPAKALLPPPPKMPMQEGSRVPSAQQIVENLPLIYAVTPFAIKTGQIAWLRFGHSAPEQELHDRDAYDEAERKVNTLLRAEGFIDLCNAVKARFVVRGSTPADRHVDQGEEVDFHEDVANSSREDGAVGSFDHHRTFELVLKNGLVVRLEAYNQETKMEWINRLNDLIKYWRRRKSADMRLFSTVRQANLEKLHVDEHVESYLGQFGQKWEVARGVASPQLYNMCGVSVCRTVTVRPMSNSPHEPTTPLNNTLLTRFVQIAGVLYRKPRRYSTFKRYDVILCHGQLLLFDHILRERTGKAVPHIHNDRHSVIDLKACYVYSGLVTEGDLLSQNQSFDNNHPGRHALPRVYLEDGWTSSDEDIMTCFVIWQNKKKSFFRADGHDGQGKRRRSIKQVSQLGKEGKSMVFKTRSRAERDHWVLSIGLEIERLQQAEEFRIVS